MPTHINRAIDNTVVQSHRALASMPVDAQEMLGKFDHVTKLPNRIQFIEDMEKAQAVRAVGSADRVLLLCTLADAKHYNEILRALGHAYSEDFVREGAGRIISVLPHDCDAYHVSVLSFATLLPAHRSSDAEAIADQLHAAFEEPVYCQSLPISTDLGVGLSPQGSTSLQSAELLRSCLAAAQDSRNTEEGWRWYNQESDEAHLRAFRILTDLGGALKHNRGLSLKYQPRIDMKSGRCTSVEALLRWNHPQLGDVSPGEFIPLAETTALIADVTHWVISKALQQGSIWRNAGLDIKISLNVSPKDLADPVFLDFFLHECDRHNFPPSQIEFEFTEGIMSPDSRQMFATMESLKALNVEIAIDDFGSGYSNMSYLTSLPAKTLKIDQSFIRSMSGDARKAELVRSIINLGHNLGYRLVAEGIETRESYEKLAEWQCDEGQGYFMSKPLSPGDFEAWLDRSENWPLAAAG